MVKKLTKQQWYDGMSEYDLVADRDTKIAFWIALSIASIIMTVVFVEIFILGNKKQYKNYICME